MELFEPRSTSLRGNHNGSSSSNPELFDIIHSNRGGSYYYNNSSNVNGNGEDIGIRQSTSDIIEDRHHHQQQLYYSHYYPPPSSTTMPSSEFPPHQQHCIKWGGGSAGFKGGSKESENGEMKPNINININNGNNNNNNNLSVIVPSFVRRQRPSSVPPRCRVEGCKADLSHSKGYHRRHKVCDNHSKAPLVVVNSVEQRFCQQCSRFHLVAEFDDAKRSCRRRLASHNERRRKSTQESMALMSTLDDRRSFDLVVDRNCNYQQLDSAINRAAAASSMNWMKFPLDMSMNMPAYNQGMKDPFSSYSPLHQLPCNSSTTTTSLSGGGGGGYGNSSAFDRLGNGAYTAFNAVKMDPFDQERAADIIMQQQRRRGGGAVVELASNNGGYGSSGAINMQGHNSNYCDEEVEVRKAEEAEEEEEEEALTLFDSPFVHEEKSGQRRRPPCSNSVSEVAPGRALSLLSALQLPPPSSTNTDTTITTTSAVAAASSTGSCFDLVADNSRPSFSRGFNLNHSYTSISHHNRHQQFASLVMADPDAPFDSMSHTFDSLHHL